MLKRMLVSVFLLMGVGPVLAEPMVQPITKSGDQLGVLVNVTRIVPVVREVVVNVNGVNQVQKVTTAVAETVTQFTPINDKVGTFYDLDGKVIPAKILAALLKEKVNVALVYDGEVPNADARKALASRKAEFIIVMKAEKKEMPALPVPVAPKVLPAPPVAAPPALPVQPPFFVSPAVLKDDTLTVTQTVTLYEQVQVAEKRLVEGKEVVVTVVQMVPVQKQVTIVFAVKDLTFQTLDGKKIEAKELPKLLKDNAKIVMSSTDAPPTADQLKALKDVVLVALRKAPEKKVAPKP